MNRVSISRLIALHILGCVGLIAYSLVLETYGRDLHSVGKDLGRLEMYGELRKSGIDVPDEFRPSISKGRIVGPAVELSFKALAIFWPSVIIQCHVLLALVRYRLEIRKPLDNAEQAADGKTPQAPQPPH